MYKKIALFFTLFLPFSAHAVEFNGASLSSLWVLPFAGIILSVAIFPLFAHQFWVQHFGKITAFWACLFFVPLVYIYGIYAGLEVLAHVLFSEYIPFVLLLVALYTISGGIHISGNLAASPKRNVSILAIGTLLASIMGTTGASMLLIRPILQANKKRKYRMHVVIFFIFLVANIGGGLTPLGDPPLFLGFLEGVDFFWTLKYMFWPVVVCSVILLALFFALDSWLFKKEALPPDDSETNIVIVGKQNFLLIGAVVTAIIISGFYKSGIVIDVFGTKLTGEGMLRDSLFIIVTFISLKITSKQIRIDNKFNWEPMLEVGKLFIGIFLTIVPVIAILKAGEEGAFSAIFSIAHDEHGAPINVAYFWITTMLSAFLDNAPTYLVFFNMAPGDAEALMGPLKNTLLAISMGTVFTGPLTYIGNAPNFMVKSLAEQAGVKMPSFFGYMLISLIVMVPIYILLNFLFLI